MNKGLKIAMFFSSDPSTAGGVQEHIYYLAKNLNKLGHKVSVFAARRSKYVFPYPNLQPIGQFNEFSLPSYDVSFISRRDKEDYQKIFNKDKFDLIHIHDPFMPFLAWEILGTVNLPMVTTYHATWDDDSPLNVVNGFIPLLKNGLSKNVKGSIFVSKRTRRCWQEVFHPGTKKTVIGNGIDSSIFEPLKKKENKIIKILFLARIVPRKGLFFLLKAFKKVVGRNKNINLSIVGEGPQRKNMEEFVKKNNLKKYVKFFGHVKNKDKPKFFQTSDIFCAPYINEGFGITILEAMASGVPIVGFKNNAFSEVLRRYPEKELLVKPKSVEHLAHALEKAISDNKVRQRAIDWELQEIKKYSWATVAKQTEEFYYRVVKK